ncbi:MAG TPA: PAS domain-containing protein, partial [Candidatus Lokiarchaeia archaeon]
MLKQVEESKIVNINKIQIKSKELVLSIDQNEKIIKFNEECELIFGYKKDEVLNRPFFDFLIPERYSRSWKNMFK